MITNTSSSRQFFGDEYNQRKKNKTTQQELAELIHGRQSHIARLETGEVSPSLKALKRYANGLGYTLKLNLIPIKNNKSLFKQ